MEGIRNAFLLSIRCIGAGNSIRCMNYALWLFPLLLGSVPTALFFQGPFDACILHVLHADTGVAHGEVEHSQEKRSAPRP